MSSRVAATILWRRLDTPGHDAASLLALPNGYRIRGTAVFAEGARPTALHYTVDCDVAWQTTCAHVEGWYGDRLIELTVDRDASGRWRCAGAPHPALDDCPDLDLSFSPATNLIPLRRLQLAIGGAAEVRAAWVEWPVPALSLLVQRYARRSATHYDYEADLPDGGKFMGVLQVDADGWVVDYANLWRAEHYCTV